jgi:hypothetical protein
VQAGVVGHRRYPGKIGGSVTVSSSLAVAPSVTAIA